jgi:two-component system, OmpR family, alkaline phosphatase synthesis response regulator PhoP
MKKKKTIIIADDEVHILELLRIVLSKDYNLIVAENGKSAIEAARKSMPDLILLDIMMPDLNGYEVCEILKKDKKTRKIKIAMLSAKGLERDIIMGLEIGADYYITKPFDPIELEKKVHEIVYEKEKK